MRSRLLISFIGALNDRQGTNLVANRVEAEQAIENGSTKLVGPGSSEGMGSPLKTGNSCSCPKGSGAPYAGMCYCTLAWTMTMSLEPFVVYSASSATA